MLAIPAVIWAKSVLNLLHKLPVLAAAFWILVAVFAWQAALVGALLQIVGGDKLIIPFC